MAPAPTVPGRFRPKDPAPPLQQLRVPSDASLPGIASYAGVIWRLTTQHLTTSGAGFYLPVVVTALWVTSLFIRFVPSA